MASKKNYTFIDLFAGCGGLSEGFYRKRFEALAHVEIDKYACETLRRRMMYYGYADADKKVIEHDITADDGAEYVNELITALPAVKNVSSSNYQAVQKQIDSMVEKLLALDEGN